MSWLVILLVDCPRSVVVSKLLLIGTITKQIKQKEISIIKDRHRKFLIKHGLYSPFKLFPPFLPLLCWSPSSGRRSRCVFRSSAFSDIWIRLIFSIFILDESRNASRLDVSSQVQMNGTLNKEAPIGRESEPPAKPLKQANGATQAKPSQTVVKQSPKPETAWSGELLLFGKHAGKSFEWLLQNHENYAVYVVATHLKERDEGNMSQNKLMKNKDALAEYVRHFSHVMEEVHFYREGLAPIGFGKYADVTRQELYNSTDEKKKSYVNWLRSLEFSAEGDQMEAVLKYISHRDKKGASCPFSRFMPPPKRRSPRRSAQSENRYIAAKKPCF
ncbi:uncharacterized protein LOC110161316 isoform X1 [Boleophthalmus pectinirostris]|uniref:uncharacterized protein LOC110161316 isoform X1 n=1 Tax=Boleophthalmus pectinirostris TaxID=150288 RepID=UPI00242BCF8D|nr:uncharacterized protein LOC110161316 isoform X1 [Boleophthalmus pectinirostris]